MVVANWEDRAHPRAKDLVQSVCALNHHMRVKSSAIHLQEGLAHKAACIERWLVRLSGEGGVEFKGKGAERTSHAENGGGAMGAV